MCEHDSTIWVYFCLLEFVILWRICALSSEEEEERRVSFDNKSFGDFSEVGCHVRDVTLRDVVFRGTGAHPCRVRIHVF